MIKLNTPYHVAEENVTVTFTEVKNGGKTYRAFLEGRVKDKTYVLLMYLSNLELKGI